MMQEAALVFRQAVDSTMPGGVPPVLPMLLRPDTQGRYGTGRG